MTVEDTAKELLRLHWITSKLNLMNWDSISSSTKDKWIRFASLNPYKTNTPEEFYDLAHQVWGPGPYPSLAASPPYIQQYYRDFWTAATSQSWDDTGTTIMGAPSTGELKRSEYKLRASGRKFTIMGYLNKKNPDNTDAEIMVLQFLDDKSIVELDKKDFESVAVKL